ncbi:hypothetical protein SUS17_2105 [Sphingomonas sp. S17]|uniref:head-tail connector protein n=1 Tax=Sphingomonas sp. S17 TaxID=1007104 RepID=UPI00020A25F8|nr:hypothetical protein [Sphingomonas sp. S17]EGI55101.1 hypothetical protein SUS17_2105 [Sphingomonas sp. S17]
MAITIRATAPLDAGAVLPDDLVAQQLRRDSTHDDTLVASHRLTALRWIEKHVAVSLQRRGWMALLDGFPPTLRLPVSPVATVEKVTYLDAAGTAIDAVGLWRLSDSLLVPAPAQSWPATLSGPGAVTIEFTAGYVDARNEVPNLTTAALMMIQHLYDGGSLTAMPPAIDMLLDLDRVPVMG